MVSPPGDGNFKWSEEHQLYVDASEGIWFDPEAGLYSDPYSNAWIEREAAPAPNALRLQHRVQVVEAPVASPGEEPRRELDRADIVKAAAKQHGQQRFWSPAARVCWWGVLFPVALACWACSLPTASSRRLGLVGAGASVVVLLVMAGLLATSVLGSGDESLQVAAVEEVESEASFGVMVVLPPEDDDSAAPTTTLAGAAGAPSATTLEVLGEVAFSNAGSRYETVLDVGESARTDPELIRLLSDLASLIGEPAADRPSYPEESLGPTADLDDNCRSTRVEVLLDRAAQSELSLDGCLVVNGAWFDPFSGRVFESASDVDVVAVVSFRDAWDSGLWRFSEDDQMLFANAPTNLEVMGVFEASVKGDLSPSGYTPTNIGQQCAYLAQYAVVKVSWGLTISRADYTHVRTELSRCDDLRRGTLETVGVSAQVADAAPSASTTVPRDCHPNYSPCIPFFPGDALNCDEIDETDIAILGLDPYNLDPDNDGVGCGG